MSNTKRAGTRERLLARRRPQVVYPIAVEDETAAAGELEAAKEALAVAQLRTGDGVEQGVAEAEKRVEKAKKALDACYERVTLTALPPVEFEKLAAEHPARDGEGEAWNAETFPRACFLACVDTSDLTAEEWAELLDSSMSQGEQQALFLAALNVNARWPSASLPNA